MQRGVTRLRVDVGLVGGRTEWLGATTAAEGRECESTRTDDGRRRRRRPVVVRSSCVGRRGGWRSK